MMHSTLIEIKALLTLALLKSGTNAKDIKTAVEVASAARLMAAEEYDRTPSIEPIRTGRKVTNIRAGAHDEEADYAHQNQEYTEGLNSDIKALLSLLLLQQGASSKEILTTLRLATGTGTTGEDQNESEQIAETPATRNVERRSVTPKQAFRNEQLAPNSRWGRAA
jgi:hypothetical protein